MAKIEYLQERRRKKFGRNKNFTKKVLSTITLGAIGLSLAGGLAYYKFKYDFSPIEERIVEKGDTLTCYAKYEGLTDNSNIASYTEAMKRANDYYIDGKKAIEGPDGRINIPLGRRIFVLDYNRDKSVGCLK